MCRLGAAELTKTIDIVNQKFPGLVKFIGISFSELGYDEFKSLNLFKEPLFVNPKGTIYKALRYKKPGCLSCWGFCKRTLFKRFAERKKYNINGNFQGNLTQLGGSFIVNSKGDVIYRHIDSFLGDHASEDEILEAISDYYSNKPEYMSKMFNDVIKVKKPASDVMLQNFMTLGKKEEEQDILMK